MALNGGILRTKHQSSTQGPRKKSGRSVVREFDLLRAVQQLVQEEQGLATMAEEEHAGQGLFAEQAAKSPLAQQNLNTHRVLFHVQFKKTKFHTHVSYGFDTGDVQLEALDQNKGASDLSRETVKGPRARLVRG